MRFFFLLASLFLCQLAPAQTSRKVRFSPVSLGFDLPDSYKQRTFIKGLAGFTNNIDQLVGSMVLIEDNKTSVLTRFVRQDKPPVVSASTSEVIYSAKIDNKFKFNGTYAIASTKVARDCVNELVITDVGTAFLPEDYIPYLEICRAAGNVSPETRKNTFYVRSAKLTTVYSRAYRKVADNVDIAGVAFSVGGEIFSSTDNFKVDYIVSVDIVSLEKLLSLQNCNDLINSEEIARRERAEETRLAAIRAEEERKAREAQAQAAKSEVEVLQKMLADNLQRNADMEKKLADAQACERAALEQLNLAQTQAQALSEKAALAQKSSESRENVLVTFKNKDGKVLEINSLEELSQEKLKELGFDVEVLKGR